MVSSPNDIHNMQSLTEIYLGPAPKHGMLKEYHLILHPFRHFYVENMLFRTPLIVQSIHKLLTNVTAHHMQCIPFPFPVQHGCNHFLLLTDLMLQPGQNLQFSQQTEMFGQYLLLDDVDPQLSV